MKMFSSAHLTHKLLIRSKFAKVSLLLVLNAASSVSVAGDSISLDTLLLVTSHEDVSRVTRGDETCAPLHGVTATEVQSSGWSVWRRAGRGGAGRLTRAGAGVDTRDVTRCHAVTLAHVTAPHISVSFQGGAAGCRGAAGGRAACQWPPPAAPCVSGPPAPIPPHPITTPSFVWCLLQSLGKPWEGIRSPRKYFRKVGLRTFLFISFPSLVFN